MLHTKFYVCKITLTNKLYENSLNKKKKIEEFLLNKINIFYQLINDLTNV